MELIIIKEIGGLEYQIEEIPDHLRIKLKNV